MCQVLCIKPCHFDCVHRGWGLSALLTESKGVDLRSLSHGVLDVPQGWMQEDHLLCSEEGQPADGMWWCGSSVHSENLIPSLEARLKNRLNCLVSLCYCLSEKDIWSMIPQDPSNSRLCWTNYFGNCHKALFSSWR